MLRFRSYLLAALLLSIFLAGAGRLFAQSSASSGASPPAASDTSASPSASSAAGAGSSASGSSTDAQQGFETFVLPSPTQAIQNGTTATPALQPFSSSRNSNQVPFNGDSIGARIGLTLFPGNSDLGIFLAGKVGGRNLQSQLNPLRWLQGNYADAGYVELSHNGQGFRVGNGPEDVLGNSQTVRLFGLGRTGSGTIGLSLYHDISDENPFSGTPAVDDDWRMGRGLDTDLLVAADSSWRLSQSLDQKQWQLSTFAGRDHHTNRDETGLFASVEPDKTSSLYSNLTSWYGNQPGYDWSVGGTHRFGPLFVGIDNTLMNENSDFLRETGVGLILPLHNSSLAFRMQRGIIDTTDDFGLGNQRSNIVFGSYATVLNSETVLSLTGGDTTQTGSPDQRFVALSASRVLNSQWNLYADIVQKLNSSQRQIQLAVGYKIDQNWQLRLLCGPSALVTTTGQTPEALGIQITRTLDIKHIPTGTIQGQVTLEGKPYSRGLTIWLDSERAVKTDSQGRYKLSHVLPGAHTVQIAPTSLPADLSPDKFSDSTDVKAGKTSVVDFSVQPVAQILGSIKVLPDAFGKIDPTAGIGVTISAGDKYATTTDQTGHFVLGDIPAGTYTVSLNKGTIPPDFTVDGPDSFTVSVVPDQPSPAVQFTIKPGGMNIDFAQNTSAAPPATSPTSKANLAHPAGSATPSHPATKLVPSKAVKQAGPAQSAAMPVPSALAKPDKPASIPGALTHSKTSAHSAIVAHPVAPAKSIANTPAHGSSAYTAQTNRHAKTIHAGMRHGCVGCSLSCHGCRHCRCAHCGCTNGRCACAMRSRPIRRHHLRRRVAARHLVRHISLARSTHPRHLRLARRHRSRLCRCTCRIAASPRHPRLSGSR